MKKSFYLLLSIFMCVLMGCDNDENHTSIPVNPILKDIKMPLENEIIPGNSIRIIGLGFSKEDKVYLVNRDDLQIEVEVVEVTDSYLEFIVPIDAGGEYQVIIERCGMTTKLRDILKVPLVVPITDVILPSENLPLQSLVKIAGKGFQDGDIIQLSASFYPENTLFDVPVLLNDAGIEFYLPKGVYGINSVVIVRGERKTNLGTIIIETKVGDKIGGGVVFWTDESHSHGYIVNMKSVGTATEQFGPEVSVSDAAGTSQNLGAGYTNTQNIVDKFNELQNKNNWPEWKGIKIAAQLCLDNVVVDGEVTYSDWFLPSRQELIEVFKVKNVLAEQGVNIPANNYWTSSEADGDAGWAAYYVNFYEATEIISDICSKSGWTIGVLPIRSY